MIRGVNGGWRRGLTGALVWIVLAAAPVFGQAPIAYRVTFPAPEHRWLEVEVTFRDLGTTPLRARMSRSSPGRYALHEFAKNVYDVRAFDGTGRPAGVTRPDPYGWTVERHDGTVRLVYKVFGDRVDGTYLAVDTTHAHLNMPATLMWAAGLEGRAARIRFEPPAGSGWRVATQLFPTDDPLVFDAPNLQYLMDSPTELSAFVWREFRAGSGGDGPSVRIALHHSGTDAEADRFAADVERLVVEAAAVFGELPKYDGGTYTFIADYLPWASGDGMEHRNSTILTSSGALGGDREELLSTVAHEFFHCWNVERIRPRSLEPFDFERANMSSELWLAEGFTSYYELLLMARAGLAGLDATAREMTRIIDTITRAPGRLVRSAADMSRLAPFVDAARSIDRTNFDNTFISYYTWGAGIGLGLDLSLRERSNGKVTLDDYMRALWRRYGKPDAAPGFVAVPYTMEDARTVLAEVSGDRAFADDFFERYIDGHEVVDYGRLLETAGFDVTPRNSDTTTLGGLRLAFASSGARLTELTPFGSPAYEAGLELDDVIESIDGQALTSGDVLSSVLARHRPGDRVPVRFRRRGGVVNTTVTLGEERRLEVTPARGGRLTGARRAFRDAWVGSRVAASVPAAAAPGRP